MSESKTMGEADKIAALAALGKEHGEVAAVDTPCGTAFFRKPTRAEYKRHLGMIFDEKKRADAVEWLARACVVQPARETFDAWLDDKPGIPVLCADALTKLAGASRDEHEGK